MKQLTELQSYSIRQTLNECGCMIEDRLTQIVKAIGENYDEAICGKGATSFNYYKEEFGMNEEEEDGVKITKVLNFYDNGGCMFVTSALANSRLSYTSSFYALYIVETEDKEELKYYRLFNADTEYRSEESEPDHGYVSHLNLAEMMFLIQAIHDNFSN